MGLEVDTRETFTGKCESCRNITKCETYRELLKADSISQLKSRVKTLTLVYDYPDYRKYGDF